MAYGAPDILLVDNYDTLAALSAYPGPILIIHGIEDKVVPVGHALELKARLPHARLMLEDCGHSDCPKEWDAYWKAIMTFLEQNVPAFFYSTDRNKLWFVVRSTNESPAAG
jgi:fermentation-respiration switch protein FrsA (DUF1100 family)